VRVGVILIGRRWGRGMGRLFDLEWKWDEMGFGVNGLMVGFMA
jgi:hypothetical protein